MRRDSSNFSWNIQRLIAASMRTRIGSIRMTIAADASSVLKKNSPCSSGADPAHQHAVDQRQDEHQRAQHQHAAEQLVQVEKPVANQVLRQEVHVDDDEDVAEVGAVRQRLQQRRRDRRDAADHQVEEAGLLDAGRGRPVAGVEVEHRQVEADEDVGQERAPEPHRRVHRLDELRDQQRHVEDARADDRQLAERRRTGLVAQEGLEEALRRGGQRHRDHQRHPVEELRIEALGHE
jgi:hypothetical protein